MNLISHRNRVLNELTGTGNHVGFMKAGLSGFDLRSLWLASLRQQRPTTLLD